MRQEGAKPQRDAAIARLAARQHGVICVQHLYGLGVPASSIKRRVAAGRLHRIHRGVYAVGHTGLSNEGRWMAAVLACGEGAVLSHSSAGELWGIVRARRPAAADGRAHDPPPVQVTVRGVGGRKGHRGIALHRSSTLTDADCTRRDGIPVTKPARTLVDLVSVLSRAQLAAALREAEFLRLPVGAAAAQSGVAPPRTRSELEERFLALLRRHRLPQPEVNVRLDRFIVDFHWRAERLVVEVDGWESHGTRSAFEQDRSRDVHLKLLGFDVVRFTWRQIALDRATVAATIRGLLNRCSVWGRT
jgi:very-short-patch-repair endonuclease